MGMSVPGAEIQGEPSEWDKDPKVTGEGFNKDIS